MNTSGAINLSSPTIRRLEKSDPKTKKDINTRYDTFPIKLVGKTDITFHYVAPEGYRVQLQKDKDSKPITFYGNIETDCEFTATPINKKTYRINNTIYTKNSKRTRGGGKLHATDRLEIGFNKEANQGKGVLRKEDHNFGTIHSGYDIKFKIPRHAFRSSSIKGEVRVKLEPLPSHTKEALITSSIQTENTKASTPPSEPKSPPKMTATPKEPSISRSTQIEKNQTPTGAKKKENRKNQIKALKYSIEHSNNYARNQTAITARIICNHIDEISKNGETPKLVKEWKGLPLWVRALSLGTACEAVTKYTIYTEEGGEHSFTGTGHDENVASCYTSRP